MKARSLLALGLLVGASACSFARRDATMYRDDSRALLSSRNDAIKGCYDDALKQDPQTAGVVVVNLKIAKDTGQVSDARVDEQQTTAPASLGQCITRSVEGLELDPADANDGIATFRWEFKPRA